LRRKVQEPARITDCDALAAMFLASTALSRKKVDEAVVHARGCLKILDHLRDSRCHSAFLGTFTTYILDDMKSIISRSKGAPVTPRSGFSERLVYYRELCKTGTPRDAWHQPRLETLHSYLWGSLSGCLRSLRRIVIQEGNGINCDGNRQALARYLKAKLNDGGFNETFTALLNQDNRSNEPENKLKCYQFIGAQVLAFVLHLLDHPASIVEGLHSHETRVLAEQIHLSAMKYGNGEPTLKYHSGVYSYYIAVVGLAVAVYSDAQANECKTPQRFSCSDSP